MNEIETVVKMNSADTEHIRAELEKASSLIAMATMLAKQGRLVSVVSLKNRIRTICEAVRHAGYRQCQPVKKQIKDLMVRVDDFERVMHDRFSYLLEDKEGEE